MMEMESYRGIRNDSIREERWGGRVDHFRPFFVAIDSVSLNFGKLKSSINLHSFFSIFNFNNYFFMVFWPYKILLKKYLLIDFGVLLLLTVLPLYISPGEALSATKKALLFSGLITPAISYLEIKRNHILPFFDNLRVSFISFYSILFLLKMAIIVSISLYV